MKQLLTQAIILSRVNYGEADRIITLITPDNGKIRLMARGVRRVKSKLAGGIELFSVSDIVFMPGRGEIGTLVSTRLIKYYGNSIVKDINRVQLGYELIKMLHRVTEDEPEAEYFALLQQAFVALEDEIITEDLIRLWFHAQLIRQAGHAPNLQSDIDGNKLQATKHYDFDDDAMTFVERDQEAFSVDHIKFLRLLFSGNQPKILSQVTGYELLLDRLSPILRTMLNNYLRV